MFIYQFVENCALILTWKLDVQFLNNDLMGVLMIGCSLTFSLNKYFGSISIITDTSAKHSSSQEGGSVLSSQRFDQVLIQFDMRSIKDMSPSGGWNRTSNQCQQKKKEATFQVNLLAFLELFCPHQIIGCSVCREPYIGSLLCTLSISM